MSNAYDWCGDRATRHCRWCGMAYIASRPIGKDGFCKPAHKQALYRAFKKWKKSVTAKSDIRPGRRAAGGPSRNAKKRRSKK